MSPICHSSSLSQSITLTRAIWEMPDIYSYGTLNMSSVCVVEKPLQSGAKTSSLDNNPLTSLLGVAVGRRGGQATAHKRIWLSSEIQQWIMSWCEFSSAFLFWAWANTSREMQTWLWWFKSEPHLERFSLCFEYTFRRRKNISLNLKIYKNACLSFYKCVKSGPPLCLKPGFN